MTSEPNSDSPLELAHVLFTDIVGYSKLLGNQQRELFQRLNQIICGTRQFQTAEAAGKLVRLPTGDGMALAFFTTPDAPVRCAREISRKLQEHPEIRLRMGINSGPVEEVTDVNGRRNVTGPGINLAQRVMDCADAGHILLAKRVADDLAQYGEWQPHLHDLGKVEVKHGTQVEVVNFYEDGIGNPAVPEKIRRAEEGRAALLTKQRRARRRRISIGILSAVVLLLGLGGGNWVWQRRAALTSAYNLSTAGVVEKSIAVLPFEYFGGDKDDAYLADGVQDDILTDLAKVADLKVISRRSVAQYRGSTTDVREIGKALQVAYVLEGTVRKVGGNLRVTAQLIDTRTEGEKWAEKYDREFAGVFAIQNEISETIADQLKAVLTPEEKASIETAPTKDMEAYDLYLRARSLVNAFGLINKVRHENRLKAEPLLQAAVARDPNFALAYCLLAEVQSNDPWQQPTPERITQARGNLETALKLAPESGEVHLQLGSFYYSVEGQDSKRAEEEFRSAARKLPNSVVALRALADFLMNQGQWKEALRYSRRAAELDPRDPEEAFNLAHLYGSLRRYDEAEKVLDNAIAFLPHESTAFLWTEKGQQAAARGDTKAAMAAFDAHPFRNAGVAGVNFNIAKIMVLDRRYDEAVVLLSSLEEIGRAHNTLPSKNISWNRGEWELELATVLRAQGQKEKAQAAFEACKKDFNHWLTQEDPNDAKAQGYIAICDAALGNKEEALREGRKAQELCPKSRDNHWALQVAKQMALVYAWTGDHRAALNLLQELAPLPDCLTFGELKLHPKWDDLRQEPLFDKVLAVVAKPATID
jgi:TolB-like protein/class 3 adenylate cyclase/Tfp pilus assembly protein PilF